MDGTRPLHRILIRLQNLVLERPRRVLAASALLLVLAILLASGVEFRTSRSDLAPPDDPEQQRFERLAEEFSGLSDVVACVEASPGSEKSPAELRAFADALAERFRADPEVARVFHGVELDWFLERGLHFVPPARIREAVAAAREEGGALDTLRSLRDLASLNDAIAERLESGLDETNPPPEEEAAEGIRYLATVLEWERRFLEDPDSLLSWLESESTLLRLAGERPELIRRGYLANRDGDMLYLMVTPRSDDDSLPTLQKLIRGLRRQIRQLSSASPGFHVALTGESAMTVEEMSVVRRDTWSTAGVAIAGVTLLIQFVFRWRTHSLLVLAAVAVGVIWALGAVRLEFGYLNLITSSFISTLIGVGAAYAIHPVSEYELQGAHTGDPPLAIHAAYHATGAAVTVGAVTTAAAFFSIFLMGFRGFAELGLVAGIGILLCLVASLVTLPALLVLYGRWRHARDRETRHSGAAVDRIWVEQVAGRICLFPKTTTVLALFLTAALGWAATGVRIDTNIVKLLPRDAESVRHLERMIAESDLSPNFSIAVAGDLEALRALEERAAAEGAIARYDSALRFLPEDSERSRAALSELAALLDEVRLPDEARPPERERMAASLRRLEEALSGAAEAAFGAGRGALAGPLEEAKGEAESARRAMEGAPEGMEEAWRTGQDRLLAWARQALEDLRRAARAEPPAPENLPPGIRERLMTRTGRYVALLHPAESIFDPAFLEEFIAASRRVSPEVTGFPVLFRTASRRITRGFYKAAMVAALLVFLILLADYRNLRETGLALVPLAIGVVWMMGGMRVLGLSYNFANLVAVPLIIGVGIDNGVHVIHRLRLEGASGMSVVMRHTGRAILVASLTTMIGFGSLSLASHRGLSSLGVILLLGVGACLVASTVVLPNLLVAFGMVKR
jgi:hopanoid biosynthesis associated RND transporter like protein HpnN